MNAVAAKSRRRRPVTPALPPPPPRAWIWRILDRFFEIVAREVTVAALRLLQWIRRLLRAISQLVSRVVSPRPAPRVVRVALS